MIRRAPWLSCEVRGGLLRRRVYILAAPYCTGAPRTVQVLQKLNVARRVMPGDPMLLQRLRPGIEEANVTVQKHLSAKLYLQRHGDRVRRIMRPLTRHMAGYDIFAEGPFGQTFLHPYVRRAVAPQARFIWMTRNRGAWLQDVERHECAHPGIYPESIGWHEDRFGRTRLLNERWRKERRKFIRLSRDFPEDCIELTYEDPDVWDQLRAFCAAQQG